MDTQTEPPRLAAGVRVVGRGRDRIQAGITAQHQVVAADDSPAAAVLDTLRRGGRLSGEQRDLEVVASLEEAGLLAPPPATRKRPVVVRGDLGRREDVTHALAAAGLRTASACGDDPGLLLSGGEPEREALDPWLRERRAHLVVRIVDGAATLGPFVVPGRTACLRCLDAHRHDADPEHIPVLHRYIHEPRLDGHADELPGATTALALAWAARDLVTWLDGGRPATLSTTITLTEGGLKAATWLRHPECACGWGDSPHTAQLRGD